MSTLVIPPTKLTVLPRQIGDVTGPQVEKLGSVETLTLHALYLNWPFASSTLSVIKNPLRTVGVNSKEFVV